MSAEKNSPAAGWRSDRPLAESSDLSYFQSMSLAELESEVQKLSRAELTAFTRWLDEFAATQWDTQIEQDVAEGRLDALVAEADAEFESGKCQDL